MSRTPIREALVRLSGEGLIDTLPNRSTMVSNIDFLNMHTYFDALVLMYRVTTQLAAQYHRPEDLAGIRAHNAEFAIAVEEQDALAMISTNAALHLSIAEAGRNPISPVCSSVCWMRDGASCGCITSPMMIACRNVSSTITMRS